MLELSTGWIGPFLIVIAITLREKILLYIGKKGAFINIVYFILVVSIAFPFYMYKYTFTFTALDDKSAQEIVENILATDVLDTRYKRSENIEWKIYNKENEIYNIKAEIFKDKEPYIMYIQIHCDNENGCLVGLDKILILKKDLLNIQTEDITEKMFTKRLCNDEIIKEIFISQKVKAGMDVLFTKYAQIKDVTADYKLHDIKLSEIKSVNTKIKNSKLSPSNSRYIYSNSCKGEMLLEGDFSVKHTHRDDTKALLKYIFDDVVKENDLYIITTAFQYDVYMTSQGEVSLAAEFFKQLKMTKNIRKIEKNVSKLCRNNLLQVAAKMRNYELVKKLVDLDCDVNEYNKNGDTAMMLALKSEKIIRLLLLNGANKALKNKKGITAYEIARKNHLGGSYIKLLKP